MSKFKNKDIKDIINILEEQILLSEVSTNDLIYQPDKYTTKQAKKAAKIKADHGGGDDGHKELAQQTFDKLKNAKADVSSKLSQFKRVKGQDNDSSSRTPSGPTAKFKSAQGRDEFMITFSKVKPKDFDSNGDGTSNNGKILDGESCKFIIKSYSNNGVRCKGKSNSCNNKDWLITFTNDVKNNQNNNGRISLYDDPSKNVKSNPSDWSGKTTAIKS